MMATIRSLRRLKPLKVESPGRYDRDSHGFIRQFKKENLGSATLTIAILVLVIDIILLSLTALFRLILLTGLLAALLTMLSRLTRLSGLSRLSGLALAVLIALLIFLVHIVRHLKVPPKESTAWPRFQI
ncbi:MAG: hypothetical protein ABR874_03065 [Candidatus Sulfotelmatobacter sp.]